MGYDAELAFIADHLQMLYPYMEQRVALAYARKYYAAERRRDFEYSDLMMQTTEQQAA